MRKLLAGPLPLVTVLLLALGLRVWGLTWGLPSATHYFSYHPDESRVLQVAINMNLFAGHWLPHFYNYGSLQLYLVDFANSLAFVFGAVDIVPKDLATWYPQWARMYLIGRSLTVAMGVGTVWATYALGARLWGRRAGLLAALLLAVTPLHAQHSHWLTVDVPATFWLTLSLLWSAKLCLPSLVAPPAPNNGGAGAEGVSRTKAALLAGLFAGLAAATKYNMALALLPLALASFLPVALTGTRKANSSPAPPLLGAGGAAVLAFLLACPGALLESHKFLTDLRFEAVHVQNTDDPTFKDTGSGFVYHIATNLDAGLGLPLLLLSLASVVYASVRRERGDGLLAAFALPYYVLISLAAVRYARYVIPLLPIFVLWSGRLVADLTRAKMLLIRQTALPVGGGVLLLTFIYTVTLLIPMSSTDPRDEALKFIAHAPEPDRVGFPVQPWFGTVPLSPYFSSPQPGAWRTLTAPETAARISYSGQDWDSGFLRLTHPPLVVLSEYDYRDALRLRDPAAVAYLKELRQDYGQGLLTAGPDYNTPAHYLAGLPVHDLPHDMLYTNPEMVIYYLRKP